MPTCWWDPGSVGEKETMKMARCYHWRSISRLIEERRRWRGKNTGKRRRFWRRSSTSQSNRLEGLLNRTRISLQSPQTRASTETKSTITNEFEWRFRSWRERRSFFLRSSNATGKFQLIKSAQFIFNIETRHCRKHSQSVDPKIDPQRRTLRRSFTFLSNDHSTDRFSRYSTKNRYWLIATEG